MVTHRKIYKLKAHKFNMKELGNTTENLKKACLREATNLGPMYDLFGKEIPAPITKIELLKAYIQDIKGSQTYNGE